MKWTILFLAVVLIFCGSSLGIPTTIDYLPESFYNDTDYPVYNSATKVSQSFTGNGMPLNSCKFYLKKIGSPKGNAYVRLYAHAGTFGVDGVPTGTALATADTVLDVSALTTSYQLINFKFTTSPYTVVNGTHYYIALEPPAGTITDCVVVGANWAGKPIVGLGGWNHPGNLAVYISPVPGWFPVYDDDFIFYVISDIGGEGSDTTPPTPDPMIWATPPYAAGSTSISMTATGATDAANRSIYYYFDFVDSATGGTGGSDSGWQSSTSYANGGLQPNHSYGYRVKARDSAPAPNETSYSSPVYKYTLANAPGAASFSDVTQNCIRATWTANGNRNGTEYWCENQTLGTRSGWTTSLYWDSCPLSCGASHSFRVKARNGDGIETGWTSLGSQSTQACDTTGPSLSITSHSNGQHVSASSITLAGAASDSGSGDNGIQQVTVNGAQASNGTATGSGTANWNKVVSLNAGANTIAVVAYDNSTNHNTTTQSITIYRDAEQISAPKPPKGVSTGYTGTSYNFSTGGTSCNLKHPVEYQFDWKGDGISDLSPWGSALHAKVWRVAGTCQIRAKARCSLHPNIESGWSAALPVSVNPRPFIHVLSPNGGEAWVVGTTHTVSWESGYLNPAGTIYLFYRYDNAWHPIATLPSTTTSYDWTISEISQAVTTPAPTGRIKTASIWIGNWLGDSWECWNSSDKAFVILHDAWVFSLSSGDRGGVLLDFQEGTTEGAGQFEGHGVSLELGAFGISGAYDFDERGLMRGNYTLFDSYDLTNASVLESGNLTGGLNQQGRLTFNLKTPDGVSLFTMTGNRFFQELVVPKDWTATLTLPARVKGTLDTLTIEPYQDPITNEVYPHVFEISGSGIIPDHGSIDIEGQVFITLTTVRRGENSAYGTYRWSGYLSETGVLSGTVNLGLGTFNLTATSSNGTKYTLTGKVK